MSLHRKPFTPAFASLLLAVLVGAACSTPRDEPEAAAGGAGGGGQATNTGGATGGGTANGGAVAAGGTAGTGGAGGVPNPTGTGGAGTGGSSPGGGGGAPGAGGGSPGTGGVPSDAGVKTDAPVDAPVDATAPSKCPAGVLLCDGFEDPVLDSARWTTFSGPNSTWLVDPKFAARGAQALRLNVGPGTKDPVGLQWSPVAGSALPNPVYVRFFLWRPGTNHSGGFVSIDNRQEQAVGLEWNAAAVSLEGNNIVAATTGGTGIFPAYHWTCVVIRLQTSAGGEMALYTDGQAAPVLTSSVQSAPVFERIMFAISPDGMQFTANTFWIDEVVVSAAPIGCTD